MGMMLASCFKTPVEKWPKSVEELTANPLDANESENKEVAAVLPQVAYGAEPTAAEAIPTPSSIQEQVAPTSTDPNSTSPLQLARRYVSTKDPSKRDDLLNEILQSDSRESTKALALLVPRENDIERKLTMLQALQNMGGEIDDKLHAYSGSMVLGFPYIIREAAMKGLELINDPKAIPVWQILLTDPNPEFRDRAKNMIEQLKNVQPASPK